MHHNRWHIVFNYLLYFYILSTGIDTQEMRNYVDECLKIQNLKMLFLVTNVTHLNNWHHAINEKFRNKVPLVKFPRKLRK